MTATPSTQQWFDRLQNIMPYGSSTCSKRARLRPAEPGVIVRGRGCRVWDADGNEYIDFRNSLGPITLGYCFPAVDEAIRKQLDQGIIFGHPHPLECEVAELLCEIIPCAEQARFLKTGGEALAACIRLARHVTGRDHVIQIGYNGWLNSLSSHGRVLPGQEAAGTPPAGVPACLSALHLACGWNDAAGVEKMFELYPGKIAAICVATAYHSPTDGQTFYPALRKLADQHGAILIYDEIVSGFRLAIGGVQEYFGVVPDLAVFAKGIANGMPLSVYLGKREIMEQMDKVTVSSTYGGETLSLAAAKAAIGVYRTEGVVEHLWEQGRRLSEGLDALFAKYGLPAYMAGYMPLRIVQSKEGAPAGFKDKLFTAAYRNGISPYNNQYINFSHKQSDIDEALERWDKACDDIEL